MTYYYLDETREREQYALPNVWVFHVEKAEWYVCEQCGERCEESVCDHCEAEAEPVNEGYMYAFCFPGCMPDSEPMGPYPTEEQALKACRDEHSENDI